jgi:hypothetical protein
MSIGPSTEEAAGPTASQKLQTFVSSVGKGFGDSPAVKFFYWGMFLLLLGLPLGIKFPAAFYFVVGALGTIAFGQWVVAYVSPDK